MKSESPCRCIGLSRSLVIALACLFLWVGTASAQDAARLVRTNDPGQVAGEQVLIFGQGFNPLESVELEVVHADGTAEPNMGHTTFTVTAGADGAFVTTWVIRPQDGQGDQFLVTARGGTGVVTTTSFG